MFSLLSGHFPHLLSASQILQRVYKMSSFSFWVLRALCCWPAIMSSWIMVLQCPLNLVMLMFHLPASVVQACLPVAIRFLPLSGIFSWTSTSQLNIAKRDMSSSSTSPSHLCHLPPWSLRCLTLCCAMSTMTPENTPQVREVFCCRKALLETQEVSLWVCSFYGHFCNSYYTLDLEEILTIAHNCQALALYKSSPSKYAAREK